MTSRGLAGGAVFGQPDRGVVALKGPELPLLPELMGQLRRSFSTLRLYGARHDNARLAMEALWASLSAYTQAQGPLLMRVHAHDVEVEGRHFFEDEGREESIVRPLYVDGVEAIAFQPGLGAEALARYLEAWVGALTGTLEAEHSFATWVFEQDLPDIVTTVRPGLGQENEETPEDAAESRLAALWASLSRKTLAPRAGGVELRAADLRPIGEVLPGLDPDALDAQASALALRPRERQVLATQLAAGARGQGQRGLWLLWVRYLGAREVDRPPLARLALRLARELAKAGRLAELAKAVARIDETGASERARFFDLLGDPVIMRAALAELGEGRALIAACPSEALVGLGAPWAEAGPELRQKVTALLLGRALPAELLADWMLAHGAALAGPLFELAERVGPEPLELLLRTALVHDDPEVVTRALGRVPPEAVAAFRSLIDPRLADPRPELRRAALSVLVRSHDPGVPAFLEQQLHDPDAPLDWQRSCVHGLGVHGGPEGLRVLTALAQGSPSEPLRVAAIQALGTLPGAEIDALLGRLSRRYLGAWAVRVAARDALKRRARRSLLPGPAREPGDDP